MLLLFKLYLHSLDENFVVSFIKKRFFIIKEFLKFQKNTNESTSQLNLFK